MIEIKSIYSFVPKNFLSKKTIIKKFGKNQYSKIKNYTGFENLNVISKKDSSNFFFFKSMGKFFKLEKINKKVDAIIFSSHTRQNEMPIFAAKIQSKFKLRNNIICYDLPGSCSGFTNGLIHASAFLNSDIVKNVLLICADAHSQNLEKNLVPVIGDGISCIFLKKTKNKTFFDFGVDGLENEMLIIDPITKKLKMDGLKVFEFAAKRVPETFQNTVRKFKKKIDFYSFHQPNKTIHDHLIKKLKIEGKKVISCFDHGNTSSPSIPISISKNFPNKIINNKTFLFCGFGAGLNWSTVITKLNKTYVSKIYKI